MKVMSLHSIEKIPVDMPGAQHVEKQLAISVADGSPHFSFRVFHIGPDGHTPYHTHPFEHLNYVIEGRGVIVAETGETHTIAQGDFALVRPGERHQYKNTASDAPLVLICAVPKEHE
ncbi:MAG: cupin domain-containing protein [Kiritimatiellae bacterium]|nr:cupin domain-containing protein [Kiritimatiellia bacterium]